MPAPVSSPSISPRINMTSGSSGRNIWRRVVSVLRGDSCRQQNTYNPALGRTVENPATNSRLSNISQASVEVEACFPTSFPERVDQLTRKNVELKKVIQRLRHQVENLTHRVKLQEANQMKLPIPPEEIQRRKDFKIHSTNLCLTATQLQQNLAFEKYYQDPILWKPIEDAWLGCDGRVYDHSTLLALEGKSPFTQDIFVAIPDQFFVKAKQQYQILGYVPPLDQCDLSGEKSNTPVFSTRGHRCDRATLQRENLQELAEDYAMKANQLEATVEATGANIDSSEIALPKLLNQGALLRLLTEEIDSSYRNYEQKKLISLASRRLSRRDFEISSPSVSGADRFDQVSPSGWANISRLSRVDEDLPSSPLGEVSPASSLLIGVNLL